MGLVVLSLLDDALVAILVGELGLARSRHSIDPELLLLASSILIEAITGCSFVFDRIVRGCWSLSSLDASVGVLGWLLIDCSCN